MIQCAESQNKFLPKNWIHKSFATFEPDQNALGLARALQSRNLDDSVGVWLSGQAGSGKTHLLMALFQQIAWAYFWREQKLGDQVKFHNYADLCAILREDPNNFNLLTRIRSPKFLFIDDLGTSKTSDFIQEKIYSIFNYRCENQLPTFVTTNLNISEITTEFTERMSSRIQESAVWVKVSAQKDYRSKQFIKNTKKFHELT